MVTRAIMGSILGGFVLPLLLLTAGLLDWSLISFINLATSLVMRFTAPKRGFRFKGRVLYFWFVFIYTTLVIILQVGYLTLCATGNSEWSITDAWWIKLIGLLEFHSWRCPKVVYFLAVESLVGFVALTEISRNKFGFIEFGSSFCGFQDPFWGYMSSLFNQIGYHVRLASCFSLPAVQLVLGISYPSWLSLPFFICSCVGLVDWSLTSNFLGLFRWWKLLWSYAGFVICLLYVYQLPIGFPKTFQVISDSIGLYKISLDSDWQQICSGTSLMVFYYMLSCVKHDLEDMEFIMSMGDGSLTEQLLPSRNSFLSGVRHTNILLRGPIFRIFSINWFTYGYPISLLALSYWSFHFASICAFGLLAYVGYVMYAFPSVFHLHHLNGLLLVFILLWAVSTYIFNVAFAYVNWKLGKDMEIWETVGLWHYPIPGFFLLAQFCLGVLVALGNLVSNSVFLCLSNEEGRFSTESETEEVREGAKVLVVATIAWLMRKSSRPIMLLLIFLIATKPGFIHAVYMMFFVGYLLSHKIDKRMRQSLILLCEAHFAIVYVLQLNLVSRKLEQKGSISLEVLSQLGLVESSSPWNLLEIALLACFCAIHNHGFDMLFSFSAIVQHTPCLPVGFSILKAGLNKSVLLSVYTNTNIRDSYGSRDHERKVALYLSAIGRKFLSVYRSFGTYIAFLTILIAVHLVRPNYVSFGYIFLLLIWITGRQLVEQTKRRLWFPLKIYAIGVFIFIYLLSIFPTFESWMSTKIDLSVCFGYSTEAPLLDNLQESLAIMIVMQLYSYERRKSKHIKEDPAHLQPGVLGFVKRFLIWHSQKILFVTLFYSSISPISASGFLYLLGLVLCSALPKESRIPSKSFLVYTGLLVIVEYIFQIWGKQANMFPGQKNHDLSVFLGLVVYKPDMGGLQEGLRAKVLVIAACTLQYNVFHWLEKMPSLDLYVGQSEEPCPLFVSARDAFTFGSTSNGENQPVPEGDSEGHSWPSPRPCVDNHSPNFSTLRSSLSSNYRKHSLDYIWDTMNESHHWKKKRIVALRQERFDMQKTTLKVYLRFWIENMFNLFGLEINMIALLVASFALLNSISMLYIACIATCILLPRPTISKLWPIFVLLSATILLAEYLAMWKNVVPTTQHVLTEPRTRCHDCWKNSRLFFHYCEKCWLGTYVCLRFTPLRPIITFLGYFFVKPTRRECIICGSVLFKLFVLTVFVCLGGFSSFYFRYETIELGRPGKATETIEMGWREYALCESQLFFFCLKECIDFVAGLIVDDPRMLISYFGVFMLTCFKLRSDHSFSFSWSFTYEQMVAQRKNAFVWRDLSFETKNMWTFFDYLRVYCYCHLLDLVLALMLITGTLEYDILHLGYLGFALIFFRMRLTILKKKNKIFKFLRVYNFTVIFLSLAYQSPFIGGFKSGKCKTVDYVYEVIGFYKYDYGFRITSRSVLVEIIIFILVSCQSYMFSSSEFDYVFRYLEAEQIGAIVREQEKKAAWKNEQLQHIRKAEENKRQRNFQVEKMKSEMLNLQIQLHGMHPINTRGSISPGKETLRRRKTASLNVQDFVNLEKSGSMNIPESSLPLSMHESMKSFRVENPLSSIIDSSLSEINEPEDFTGNNAVYYFDNSRKGRNQPMENPLASAVQLLGDGVCQVQSIGNQAVSNLITFLNISSEDLGEMSEDSTNGHTHNAKYRNSTCSSSLPSEKSSRTESASLQIGLILSHIWSRGRSNNDVVCYCCFILVFLWNFSLLSMVYLAALFLYALCVNTGPNYVFWIIMLIYTEFYILIQYLYQIMIQHCGFTIQSDHLHEWGFPTKKIKSSFVISLLPLFLVYLFTLIQCSITAKDGEWFSVGFKNSRGGLRSQNEVDFSDDWSEKVEKVFKSIKQAVEMVFGGCSKYWKSLTQEAESPPYFVQLSMDVKSWPKDGIQPERIESGINQLLQLVHEEYCKSEKPSNCLCASKVQIQSIEKSTEDNNITLAVFEVVYASPLTECKPAEQFNSLTPAADVAKQILKAQHMGLAEKVGFPYPMVSVIGGGKREVDLYAYIFGADLMVFFLVAMFYQSVIKNKSEILEYYQLEDQFPKEFVFILIVIFFLIVVDRIIYLCSFATGKVIFYLFNFILSTRAISEYAWNIDTSQHNAAGFALRAIYLTKAVSLALQAMQIRDGVPYKSTLYRQFLTSEVSHVNYLGYRLYRALPFLYELRCVLDWSCTTTSLTMYDWLKLEDINASLYLVKCDNVLNRANHKQGEKQTRTTKFCNGFCLFFILIVVIWAPMLMYSSGNPTNIANPINDASFQFDIKTAAGRLTLYQTTLCERLGWDQLYKNDNFDPQHYLDSYNQNDIQFICCKGDASTLWTVPEVVQRQFMRSLNSRDMDMRFSWVLARDRPKGKEKVKYERSLDPSDLPEASDVIGVLNGSLNSFRISNIYPRFFRVTGSGEVRPFEQEVSDVTADLVLHHGSSQWWSFHDVNSLDAYGCGSLSGPMAVIVSEETPQGIIGETLSKFSIWGLYITFVLAVGRFIRLQCSDLRMRIPFENLPSCDRLIAICEDIYAARAEGELGVEEVLYWTLVKIYRSPHMLLEYTKPD